MTNKHSPRSVICHCSAAAHLHAPRVLRRRPSSTSVDRQPGTPSSQPLLPRRHKGKKKAYSRAKLNVGTDSLVRVHAWVVGRSCATGARGLVGCSIRGASRCSSRLVIRRRRLSRLVRRTWCIALVPAVSPHLHQTGLPWLDWGWPDEKRRAAAALPRYRFLAQLSVGEAGGQGCACCFRRQFAD